MAAEGGHLVEDLERRIDAILQGKSSPAQKVVRRKLAVTDENVRRLFGMSMWELFHALAGKFGYTIEDQTPPKA